ncbi:MAG: hypothetical protein HYX24_07130 [Candidatus Aenigmarchaeota archaeon]|nr:hypothetical protein [Candidatus Aenigmarchaeota archaeon]
MEKLNSGQRHYYFMGGVYEDKVLVSKSSIYGNRQINQFILTFKPRKRNEELSLKNTARIRGNPEQNTANPPLAGPQVYYRTFTRTDSGLYVSDKRVPFSEAPVFPLDDQIVVTEHQARASLLFNDIYHLAKGSNGQSLYTLYSILAMAESI